MAYHFKFNDRVYPCPVELSLGVLQGKWKILILWHLRNAVLRYSAIKARLPNASDKMLAQQLRELEADGLIVRTVFPVVPPHTEYTLSEKGKTLLPILKALQQWGMQFKEEV